MVAAQCVCLSVCLCVCVWYLQYLEPVYGGAVCHRLLLVPAQCVCLSVCLCVSAVP